MWPWDEIWFYFPILGSFSHFRITQIPILGSFRYHLTSTSKSNVMAYLSMSVQNFPHTRPWTRSYLLDWYLKALIWPYTVCLGRTKLFFLNLGTADRLYMFSSLDIDKTVEKTVYISIPTHIDIFFLVFRQKLLKILKWEFRPVIRGSCGKFGSPQSQKTCPLIRAYLLVSDERKKWKKSMIFRDFVLTIALTTIFATSYAPLSLDNFWMSCLLNHNTIGSPWRPMGNFIHF